MAIESQFIDYLSERWKNDFHHQYAITRHRSWQNWRKSGKNGCDESWYCESLSQASQHYSWTETDSDFTDLSNSLINFIDGADEDRCKEICLKIFDWGGVAKSENDKSRTWVKRQAVEKRLCNYLALARENLIASSFEKPIFNGADLLMNSSMTKIYAATCPEKLIIYDGRVGAALGLLAREFLSANGFSTVPSQLAFAWGDSRQTKIKPNRNPSSGMFRFPRLFKSGGDQAHAQQMAKASAILVQAADRVEAKLSDFEKALFMVGYNVDNHCESD